MASNYYNLQSWRKGRLRHLREYPLCVQCRSIGKITIATVVDHKVPHRGDRDIFFNEAGWQSMCVQHHNEKTAAEDGGFGNRRLSAGEARKPQQGCDASGWPISSAHHWRK